MLACILTFWILVCGPRFSTATSESLGFSDECNSVQDGFHCRSDISQHWGPYTPFFKVPSNISSAVDDKCEITFVQVLSRHGARGPLGLTTEAMKHAVHRLTQRAKRFPGKYGFIKNYLFNLGTADLTVYGQRELFNSGIDFYQRYESLTKHEDPFCRASSSRRVVMSAKNFTAGFQQAKSTSSQDAIPILVIPQKLGTNNTLAVMTCRKFWTNKFKGHQQGREFGAHFKKRIAKGLNSALGGNLHPKHAIEIMDMCPFDTVANPSGKVSPWCDLFFAEDWKEYNIFQSIIKYGDYGPGSQLGPTLGAGWVNELIARMTNTFVIDHTSTNSTLDDNPATFPYGKKLYADFSHDDQMVAIMSAMNILPSADPPTNEHGMNVAATVPFGARVYIEKMRCEGSEEELVRVLVNGAVVPLKYCGADEQGRCTLGKFVESQGFARKGGDWRLCDSSWKNRMSWDAARTLTTDWADRADDAELARLMTLTPHDRLIRAAIALYRWEIMNWTN